mgnify:FL=1|jgi:ribulose-phosphate 3-epimerase
MAAIVPTITTDNQAFFDESLSKFSQFSKRIQVDASDGSFAPTTLVPLSSMKFPDNIVVDLHVMSARPSEHLSEILALKPKLCILHAEVDDDLSAVYAQLKEAGIKTGLAMIKTTFPGKVATLIQTVDHVMIFAGELGSQGGTIDMMQTEKIPLIRTIRPDVEIGWDGGANLSNVRALAHANINVINVGSAITQAADAAAMYQSLVAESEKKGVLI